MIETGRDGDEEDAAVSLVRLAGARPVPPPERTRASRAYIHAAWRAGIRRRRAQRALLLAAAGLAAVGLAFLGRRGGAPEPPVAGSVTHAPATAVARLDAADSPVERETPSGWIRLTPAEPLAAGSRVRTGAQHAGFRVGGGRSVRLAAGSRLLWDAPDRLRLEAGAVYVDSGGRAAAASSFEVRTGWGAVRETGTQFEVRLEPAALRVRVREGTVAVLGRGPTLDVARGTELRVGDTGATRRAIPIHGPDWSWVLATAPAFEMEGRRLHELLGWAAREAGWELRYADAETRRRSEAAQLHGSIGGLRPDQAVHAAIPATGLPYRLRAGVLQIGPVEAASLP
jgi:hypothetical protein